MVVVMLVVINSVIGGFSWVLLMWLADVIVRLQPYTMIGENKAVNTPIKFEEIVIVMIKTVIYLMNCKLV